MYNFGIPSTLKVWIDYIARAGATFRYTENGPIGLLAPKKCLIVLARGGLYSAGPQQPLDSQEPHLRNLLTFMGITDLTVARVSVRPSLHFAGFNPPAF
jgi:FMN-dependent NADH-azoreductase